MLGASINRPLPGHRPHRRLNLSGWLLVAPAVILLLSVTLFPGLYVIYFSFQRFTLLSATPPVFVGLENYINIVTDAVNRQSLFATLLFVATSVTLEMIFGLALGLALARRTIENTIATALLLLPFALTPSVSALLWQMLLNPNYGWIDYYLQALGLIDAPIEWLSSPITAWIAVIGVDVWLATPFVALITMAGLQGLPSDVREAAMVDGAAGMHQFWYITLPLLKPFLTVALILRIVDASKVFTSIFVLTNGGPAMATRVISLAIYQIGLKDFNIGSAAAFSTLFLLVLSFGLPPLLRVLTRNTDLAEA